MAFDYITYPPVVGLPVPLSFGMEGMVDKECEYVISVHILLDCESPLVYSRGVKPVVDQRVESFSFTPPPPATIHKCSIKPWVYDKRRHPDDDNALLAYALKVVGPARRASQGQRTGGINVRGWSQTRMTLEDLMRETRTDNVRRHGFHRFHGGILDPLRDKPGLRMLEIGVENGLSMAAWVRYFSRCADDGIQGISYKGAQDCLRIACATEQFPGCEKMKIFDGDQSDSQFLRHVIKERKPIPNIHTHGCEGVDHILLQAKQLLPPLHVCQPAVVLEVIAVTPACGVRPPAVENGARVRRRVRSAPMDHTVLIEEHVTSSQRRKHCVHIGVS